MERARKTQLKMPKAREKGFGTRWGGKNPPPHLNSPSAGDSSDGRNGAVELKRKYREGGRWFQSLSVKKSDIEEKKWRHRVHEEIHKGVGDFRTNNILGRREWRDAGWKKEREGGQKNSGCQPLRPSGTCYQSKEKKKEKFLVKQSKEGGWGV